MKTFDQAIKERGLKVRRHRSSTAQVFRVFPDEAQVLRQALTDPGLTVNRSEQPGDEFQFSSRALTDSYVREYERANKLTHC